MSYYRLKDDIKYPNRWCLGDISEVDNWDLLSKLPDLKRNLEIELYEEGEEMDFTLSEVYSIPIVSDKVKRELDCFPEVAFLPLTVKRAVSQKPYFAMIVKKALECVDERRSEFQKFEVNDPVRPDKAGDYRGFMSLKVSPDCIASIDIFRIRRFETAIIISENVKAKLEGVGTTGLDMEAVV